MNFKLSKNSAFAVLLRSPWWISAAIALFVVVLSSALFPGYLAIGLFTALPFAVIAAVSAWKRRKLPSGSKVERTTEALRTMAWADFAASLEDALRKDGCEVQRIRDVAADFRLSKGGRISVVSAKRWKSAQVGIEPLRELVAARERHGASECMFIATGEISDKATQYAAQNRIELVSASELTMLLPRLV